uniref:ribosomal protein subunit 3 n=1 Tax=Gyalideopsis ozarkensis TaxID=2910267 RepID=UPI001EDE87A6|nr:ribosomal protein subunit 3 [Gyalideopsis ozarkensis]UIX51998.1 ribosomal protein subunit 3 [Gyalideopsis ozarkensis]
MNKEWYNSLYSFNRNHTKFLPAVYNYTFKLFKWYFNMTNNWIEEKIQTRIYKKIRRTSGRKIWISNPEIKHYNNEKLNITIYIYNRTYNFYKKKLELFEFTWGPNLEMKKSKNYLVKSNKYFKKSDLAKFPRLRLLKKKFPLYIGTNKIIYNKSQNFYINIIKWLKLNKYTHMVQQRSKIFNLVYKKQNKELVILLKMLKIQHYNYLINVFSKELMYLKFKQKMIFNEFKYNEMYLHPLTEFMQNIYKKKIEWNIITLKHYYLSTNILLQIIATKVKNPKFRGRYHIPLRYAMEKIRVPILSKTELSGEIKSFVGVQNVKLNQYSVHTDQLNRFLVNNTKSKIWSDKNIDGSVLSNLENKTLAGVFIKIAGRLTKRYRADKAIHKWKYKGTLKNAYSAHRNYSSSLSRGYNNINVEKGRIDSNVRIGAFGLTGWIASY